MHTCTAVSFKHQGRCCICGRFMSGNTVGTNNKQFDKKTILEKLRENTHSIEYKKFNNKFTSNFSLESKYIGNYIGNGNSKNTDDNTLFLYDINSKHFRMIKVDNIISMN